MRQPGAILLFLAIALAGPARAGEQALVLDPGATRITFELSATLHTVRGSARLLEGTIHFDRESGAARGRVRVDARSAETGIDSRDEKMHAEVLLSGRHPEIVFDADRLEVRAAAAERAEVVLSGELTLAGVTRTLSIPAALRRDGRRVEGRARFEIPYVSWGLRDVSSFLLRVGKTVSVTVDVSGRLAD